MAALGPVRRALLCGIIFGGFACAAHPAGAFLMAAPTPVLAGGAPVYADVRVKSATFPNFIDWRRFCRWYPEHPLCITLIKLRRFCDRHPHHRICDDDRFCRRHPHHPRCKKDPPSPS